jgi:VCBS repeat-containing protein
MLARFNSAPTALDDAYTTNEDTALTVSAPGVLSNDTDVNGDTLTAVMVTTTTNGVLNLSSDGSFTYSPNANFNGVDCFTYQASDGLILSNTAQVCINVVGVNDAPIAADDAYGAVETRWLSLRLACWRDAMEACSPSW